MTDLVWSFRNSPEAVTVADLNRMALEEVLLYASPAMVKFRRYLRVPQLKADVPFFRTYYGRN